MNRISLLSALLFLCGFALPGELAAQGRVIEGAGYWVLDQLHLTAEDQEALLHLLEQLPEQDAYRITIQEDTYVSTYGQMSMQDVELINEHLSSDGAAASEGFTLFHDCLYQHNGECTLVHEYIYSVETRADGPVSAQIDALLERYR